ncbi:hypothetical protein GJV85_13560 (plasmid) [Sulfurimonas aquatica]|uniref:Transposase n=1 Tax=Sulfurimonas aquatica TaxID=2672570 RepID=A0A975B2T8_9BACT|nr:DUF6262 family protein [Sulfurimonas aquatica]QSZ43196.1 hypothetical protein GJV85_13560 [Sulfurimonas aquatica]
MAKGDSLKKFKSEQKEKTTELLQTIIEELQALGEKVTVSKVATLSGLSRANIYANYKSLFEDSAPIESKTDTKELRQGLKEKDNTLHKLRQENKALKEANTKLMDQLVMMKILVDNCNC